MNMSEFKNPSAFYRPAPFWSWNDKMDKDELKRQIREMADKGWGGYFMHSRVGLVTGYLSDEWMEMIRACAEAAGETGTYAWLYDEDKWPSGFAGGELARMNEAYRSRALVLLLEAEVSEGDTVMHETVVDGRSYRICKRVSQFGNLWFNGACYVDLMNPEAVKEFISLTHERYKKACGEYFGKEIPGIFTDEPCYLMEGEYQVPALPWSEYLPEFFSRTKGYDIYPHLECLFFEVNDYKKVRFDFFDCATRLFMESFTEQYYAWCVENNLKMTGHFMAEDTMTYQTQWIGAAMPHYQFMHWPGIDKLARHTDQLVTVKQVTSVVDQLDKEHSFCEVFGCIGQQSSFYHRKWIADWEAALGISFINHHLSLYSMRGERKRDYPPNFFYQQPWWEDEKPLSDYFARLNYGITEGRRKVDILVLHTIASVWSEYSPLHKEDGLVIEKSKYDIPFEILSNALIANKLDFHYGDEIIMEDHAKVEKGKLIIGSHSYSTVVVPPCCTIGKRTLELLKEFARQAGRERLIFVKSYPERVEGEKCDVSLADDSTRKFSVSEVIDCLDTIYKDRLQIIDRITGGNAGKIICHERETDEGDIIFIANTDETREIQAEIRIPGTHAVMILDMFTGNEYCAPITHKDGYTAMELIFYPAGSILLLKKEKDISSEDCGHPKLPSILDSGVAFNNYPGDTVVIEDWKVSLPDENVLPLNDLTLYMDGIKVLENRPVSEAWHDHFYKAPDGTPFRAEYSFNVVDMPEGELVAVIECAENLERITLNGKELKPLRSRGENGPFDAEKSWLDVSFTRIPLQDFVVCGVNTLAIEGKKINNITAPGCHVGVKDFQNHLATEVEAVYIIGEFKVLDMDRETFSITKKDEVPCPGDLTIAGYPFYAGRARFSAEFCIDRQAADGEKKHCKTVCLQAESQGPVLLKITDVEAACIKLRINGEYVGLKYWAPYIFDVSAFIKEGRNVVEVEAVTTLFNLMGPGRNADIFEEKFVGPYTFIKKNVYTAKYQLLPFGIGKLIML